MCGGKDEREINGKCSYVAVGIGCGSILEVPLVRGKQYDVEVMLFHDRPTEEEGDDAPEHALDVARKAAYAAATGTPKDDMNQTLLAGGTSLRVWDIKNTW